ncbi:hypothetical protein ASD67_01590 [Sphingopyxis sp. Root1497]|nr:hypothetical protein ASD67_01590 [Sphingopyxis sp. Root1497]
MRDLSNKRLRLALPSNTKGRHNRHDAGGANSKADGVMDGERRGYAAIGILMLILGASSLMLLLSCIAMARFTITGEHGIGWLFNLIVANGGAGITGKALAAILAVGAAYVADPDRHPLIFWVTVVLCVVALASAMTMLVLLGDETLARHLYDWAPSGIDEATAYGKAANLMLGGFIAWVLGVLSVQVGLKLS